MLRAVSHKGVTLKVIVRDSNIEVYHKSRLMFSVAYKQVGRYTEAAIMKELLLMHQVDLSTSEELISLADAILEKATVLMKVNARL